MQALFSLPYIDKAETDYSEDSMEYVIRFAGYALEVCNVMLLKMETHWQVNHPVVLQAEVSGVG